MLTGSTAKIHSGHLRRKPTAAAIGRVSDGFNCRLKPLNLDLTWTTTRC